MLLCRGGVLAVRILECGTLFLPHLNLLQAVLPEPRDAESASVPTACATMRAPDGRFGERVSDPGKSAPQVIAI